jgi:hypothetical protein
LIVILPRIIKGKVDLAPENQAIDTCELEEIKLCGFFISVLVGVRCLVLFLCHFKDNDLYRDSERGRCMVYISYIVNNKTQGRKRSSRMCMRGINTVCFKIER